MRETEVSQLYADITVYGYRAPESFSGRTMKLYHQNLANVDFADAQRAFAALQMEVPLNQWISPAQIIKKVQELQGESLDPEMLLAKVQEWLEVDELWARWSADEERNYGLDRHEKAPRPPKRPDLPRPVLDLINKFGGPESLYEELVLGQNRIVRAQFKQALTSIPTLIQMQALEGSRQKELS